MVTYEYDGDCYECPTGWPKETLLIMEDQEWSVAS